MVSTRSTGGEGRRPWRAVAGLALLVVLMAAAGGPDGETGGTLGLGPLPELIGLVVFLGLTAVTVTLLVSSVRKSPADDTDEPPRRNRGWLVYLILLASLAVLLSRAPREELEPDEAEDPPVAAAEDEQAGEPLPPPRLETGLSAGLVALAVLAGATLLWSRRGLGLDDEPVVPVAVAGHGLPAAVDRARARLGAPGDPRRAVLDAYADLEEALDRLDLDRRPNETPSEHLARVAPAVAVDPGALAELALLYEQARFSRRPFTDGDVTRARRALDRLHRDLAPGPGSGGRTVPDTGGTGSDGLGPSPDGGDTA